MKKTIICAFFVAVTAILSQISMPIGPVPINLALVSVFIAGGLLGWKWGTMSQMIFVLMGATGLPVFAGFKGGIGTVLGPTGGFIIGYILCALIVGMLAEKLGRNYKTLPLAMLFGTIVVYSLGSGWFMYITDSDFTTSFMLCVVPFLLGDVIKIIISSIAVQKLYKVLYKRGI